MRGKRRWTWLVWLCCTACGGGGGGGGTPGPDHPMAETPARGVPQTTVLNGAASLEYGPPSGDDYLLILTSATTTPGSASVTLNDGNASIPPLAARAAAGRTRDWLPGAGRAAVGDQRNFNLAGIGFPVTVQATVRRVGETCLLSVDDETPAEAFSDDDLADLAATFDGQLYPRNVSVFGTPADPDNNGRVLCLFTPYVNQRGYGVFYPGDLLPFSGNGLDMLYLLVPQPDQGRDYATLRPALLATLAHELQHLTNFSHKALAGASQSHEESWLNEGLSFLAEDLNGLLDTAGGSPENVAAYFAAPERYTLLERTGAYDDGHAGAGYLFVRYLVDRYGESLCRALVTSDETGPDNVAAATGQPFAALLTDWAAAVALAGTDLTNEARYSLPGFNTHGAYGGGIALAGPRATVLDAAGGAPAGQVTLARGGARYLRLRGVPPSGLTLRIQAATADRITATVVRVPPA